MELKEGLFFLKSSSVSFTGRLSDSSEAEEELIKGKRECIWKEYIPMDHYHELDDLEDDDKFRPSYVEGNYKDGKREGLWEWYADSLPISISWDSNTAWDSNSVEQRIYQKGYYQGGKRNGFWKSYYVNGRLKEKGNYKVEKKRGCLGRVLF